MRAVQVETAPVIRQGPVVLRDVARIAGVSTATVSRAMNSPERVSEELRARIQSVVESLGWVPHSAARTLATRRSRTIGAVIPSLANGGDFPRAIQALQRELAAAGYTLLIAVSEYDREQELKLVRTMLERGVEGLALIGCGSSKELSELTARYPVPIVRMFVYGSETEGICVGPNNRQALHRLTSYLIGLGHRRFGIIAQQTANNERTRARLQGMLDALAENGIAVHPKHLVQGLWTVSDGRELFHEIMQTTPHPTAVICGNSYLAVGALLEAQAMGIRVPRDLSIVGYDDIDLMGELPVPLTTVKVSGVEVGEHTARIMIAHLNGNTEETAFECSADIIVRASADVPPGQNARKHREPEDSSVSG